MSTATTTSNNKQTLQAVFAELARGNGRPFIDAMADDFCWDIVGTGSWARRFEGKQVVREQLFKPLFEQFATPYTNRALRFIAEDEHVVVECRGQVQTVRGQAYNNTYCYVCRFENGRLRELTEYMDTALTEAVLTPPPALSTNASAPRRSSPA
jgi:ketosteroid isomerase-like protein